MDGRIVLVTGAACGLGAEIAHTLAGDHPRLIGLQSQSREDEAIQLAAEIEAAGVETVLLPFDLVEHPVSSSRELVKTFLDATESRTGMRQVHVVVNNAGNVDLIGPAAGAAYDAGPSDLMQQIIRLFRLNLAAPAFVIKELLPYLASHGRVINVSTSLNRVAARYQVMCVVNKVASDSMTTELAPVLAERHATINALLPGYDERALSFPSGMGTAPSIAQLVRFLASKDAQSITGHLIDTPADFGPCDDVCLSLGTT